MQKKVFDARNFAKPRKPGSRKKEVTFFVTEDCNLKCSYCYLPGKNKKNSMSFEVAKKAIDYFVSNAEMFPEEVVNINFIGGEPLMEIDLIDQIMDYFKLLTFQKNHPWFESYKITMTTNGTLCKQRQFQRFLRKNSEKLRLSVSLDGIKEKHDATRVYLSSGKGSYNQVVNNFIMLKEMGVTVNTKSTFSPGDLKYLKDSILFLFDLLGSKELFVNVVYEDVWQDGDELIFEDQLKQLADHIVDNNLQDSINVSLFDLEDKIGRPWHNEQKETHWCNSGHQLSISPNGNFHPCNRFHGLSMNKQLERTVGNVDDGIDFDKLRPYRLLNLRSCGNQKCLDCDVGTGCAMCSGLAYDESDAGTIFHRTDFHCKMHKARVRANTYYLERVGEAKRRSHFYIAQLKKPRKMVNIMLSSKSVRYCGYPASTKPREDMNLKVLRECLAWCRQNCFFVNLIYPAHDLSKEKRAILDGLDAQKILPYMGQTEAYRLEDAKTFVFEIGQEIDPTFTCANTILLLDPLKMAGFAGTVAHILERSVKRINIVYTPADITQDYFQEYDDQLGKIAEILFTYYCRLDYRSINRVTDLFFTKEMNNCNAGLTHLTLGPNGNTYLCPGFYHGGKGLGDRFAQPKGRLKQQCQFKTAFICKECDAYQCSRCIFDNYQKTDEYNVPGENQCILSHIEREVSRKLQERIMKKGINIFKRTIPTLPYYDPFSVAKIW